MLILKILSYRRKSAINFFACYEISIFLRSTNHLIASHSISILIGNFSAEESPSRNSCIRMWYTCKLLRICAQCIAAIIISHLDYTTSTIRAIHAASNLALSFSKQSVCMCFSHKICLTAVHRSGDLV